MSIIVPSHLSYLGQQAIAYVVKACADQSEAINTALSSDGPNRSYHLLDILPKGENSLKEKKYKDNLSLGEHASMSHMISPNSPATYNIIDLIVWKGETGFFDKRVVCFAWGFRLLAYSFFIFQKFLNPIMVQRERSCIGNFLTCIKRVYCVVGLYIFHATT